MILEVREQRNRYKGDPARPSIRVQLTAVSGETIELELLADTGSPFAVILGESVVRRFLRGDLENMETNFGDLRGGWLQVAIAELGFDGLLPGYGSDEVEAAARASSDGFAGLAGLPLLRMFEYGGNHDWFWLRSP